LLLFFFKVVIGDSDSPRIDLYDSLLSNYKIKSLKTFHTYGITFLKYFSMNGYVASCSHDDKTLYIWNPNTGESILKYTKHTEQVTSLDQIDESTLVSGSFDRKIHIWEISTGQTLKTIDVGEWVYSAVKSLSNGLIACGLYGNISGLGGGNISIYEYATGNLLQTLMGHSGGIVSIEILNEQFMASGSDDTKVIIWDLYSYSIKYNLTQHERMIRCVKRVSSSLMASSDQNGLIIIWNWLNGSLVHLLNANTLYLSSLDLYDDQTLISGSEDKTIKLWNITNGQLIKTINTDIGISSLVMLQRGKKKYSEANVFIP
jgi:WD40 repeat protein